MTGLHRHMSSLQTSYFSLGPSGGIEYAAKGMRRQVSETQDKTKKTTHNRHGMLTAGTLQSRTGVDRENCTSEHNADKSDNRQSMNDRNGNMHTHFHL
jgi:hypothetical protein